MIDFRRIALSSSQVVLVLTFLVSQASGQSGTQVEIGVNTSSEGIIYLLLVLFFALNFFTPVVRYIYVVHMESAVDEAAKKLEKMHDKYSERWSDARERASQSIRSNGSNNV